MHAHTVYTHGNKKIKSILVNQNLYISTAVVLYHRVIKLVSYNISIVPLIILAKKFKLEMWTAGIFDC